MPKFVEKVELTFVEWSHICDQLEELERLRKEVAEYRKAQDDYLSGPSATTAWVNEILKGNLVIPNG